MSDLRSDRPKDFFSAEEEQCVEAAIAAAEKRTSGEVRCYLDRDVPDKPPVDGDAYLQARRMFAKLGMHRTASRNGVLVYLAVRSRKFAIVGDEALHALVGDDFWADVVALMARHFAEERFAEGVAEGVALIGEKLRVHFPYQDDDVNELPDEISYGDDDPNGR